MLKPTINFDEFELPFISNIEIEEYDDFNSNEKGGVLPPFGSGTTTRMLPEFEEAK